MIFKNKIRYIDFLLFIGIFLLAINPFLYRVIGIEEIKNTIRIIALIILILSIVVFKKKIITDKKKLILFFITTFQLIIVNNIENVNFIIIIVIAIILDNKNNTYTMKMMYIISIIEIILYIFCLVTGIIDNVQYISSTGRNRFLLGFDNANMASFFLYSIITCIFLSQNFSKKINLVFLVLAIYVVFYYTNARTFLISGITLIIMWYLLEIFGNRNHENILKKMIILVLILIFVISFCFTLIIKIIPDLNIITSGRYDIFVSYIQQNNIKTFLFGGTTLGEVDNFYLNFLYHYGIFIYIIIFLSIKKSLIKLIEYKEYEKIAFIISLLVYGIGESSLYRPEFPCVLIFWIYIFNKNKRNTFNNIIGTENNENTKK